MSITEKTTLTAAITKVMADAGYSEASAFDQIDNAPEEKRAWYYHQLFSR